MKQFLTAIILLGGILLSTPVTSKEIQKHSTIPKEVYYEFIESINPRLNKSTIADIYHATEYYTPRYFGEDGKFEEGLVWMLSIIAQESSFRNINGDEGKSIGYGQIQISTCDMSRKHNGIKRELNLIARWENIHCSYGELNRLYDIFGNFKHATMAYNCGVGCVKYWIRKNLVEEKEKDYYDKVDGRRQKLVGMIQSYENSLKYK